MIGTASVIGAATPTSEGAPHTSRFGTTLIAVAITAGAATLVPALTVWLGKSLRDLPILLGWTAVGVAIVAARQQRTGAQAVRVLLLGICLLQGARLLWFWAPLTFPPGDFAIEYTATRALFDGTGDPYADPAAGWFPFPSFWLIHALSGFGALDAAATSRIFFALNVSALLGATWLMLRSGRLAGGTGDPAEALLLGALLLHPSTLQTLLFGQTGVLMLFLVTIAFLAWGMRTGVRWLPGLCVALAAMLKPHLAVLAAFFLVCAVRDAIRARSLRATTDSGAIGQSLLAWPLAIVGVLVLVPGGVTAGTLRQFLVVVERHPGWSQGWENNYSLAAMLWRPLALALDYAATVPVAIAATWAAVLIVGLAALARARHVTVSAHAWTMASLLPFATIWRHYYAWVVLAAYVLTIRAWRAPSSTGASTIATFAAVGMLNVLASPAFAVGALMLVLLGHAAAAVPARAARTSPGVTA